VLRQLASAVDLARAAADEVAGQHEVGAHAGMELEDAAACTHLFDADTPGYRGWRWAVTVASAGVGYDVTVSEVVLLPGPDALVAPEWVPWQERVQAGDLGVGDLMPTAPDDPRLVPGYLESDDDAIEDTAMELGLGRTRVMGRAARLDAAQRWRSGEFGPRSDMARGAPGHCVTCGFYLPLAGSLSAAFGVCANEIAPADGHLVHAEYGCGAHSEAEVEQVSPVLVADLIYDDNAMLDIELIDRAPTPPAPAELPVVEPEPVAPELAEAAVSAPAEPVAAAPEPTEVEPQPTPPPVALEPELPDPVATMPEPTEVVPQPAGPDAVGEEEPPVGEPAVEVAGSESVVAEPVPAVAGPERPAAGPARWVGVFDPEPRAE
jgi:hypothetical protein